MSNVAPASAGGPSHQHAHAPPQPVINFQHEDGDEDGEDDDDDAPKKAADKKSGRRKIKIEFINDKSRRHITFSKRKAGIMKKVSASLLHDKLRPPLSLSNRVLLSLPFVCLDALVVWQAV